MEWTASCLAWRWTGFGQVPSLRAYHSCFVAGCIREAIWNYTSMFGDELWCLTNILLEKYIETASCLAVTFERALAKTLLCEPIIVCLWQGAHAKQSQFPRFEELSSVWCLLHKHGIDCFVPRSDGQMGFGQVPSLRAYHGLFVAGCSREAISIPKVWRIKFSVMFIA